MLYNNFIELIKKQTTKFQFFTVNIRYVCRAVCKNPEVFTDDVLTG